ncbi:MAG: hypothetical protein ACRCYR_03720 [Phycicoccus sp.]
MSEDAGRLEIEVGSDTSGFAQELKRKVEAAARDVVARVKAEIDAANLKEDLRATVKESSVGVNAEVGVQIKGGVEKTLREQLTKVVRAASAGVTAQVAVEVDKRTANEMQRTLEGSGGRGVEVPARVDRKGLLASWLAARATVEADAKRKPIDLPFAATSFRSAFMPVLYAGMASLVQPLVAVIGGAVGGAAAMAGNLATVVQTLAAGPAVVGAFGLGITALTLGVSRLKGEVADIPAPLRAVRAEFDSIAERWKVIGDATAIRFWRDLRKEIRPTADTVLPLLRTGLTDASAEMSKGAVAGAKWAQTPLFSRQFKSVAADSTKLLGSMVSALLGGAKGILNIADAAGPLVDRLAGFIRRAGEWASEIAKPGAKAKEFAEDLEYAGDKAAQLWRMVTDLGAGIVATFTAGRDSGDSLLGSLERNIQKWRDWTESIEGQNTIRDWFEDVEPIARAAGRLLVDIGKSLARLAQDPNVANMLDSIRTDLLPNLERFLNVLGRAVGPQVVELLESALRVLTEMSSAGGPIGTALGIIARGLTGVADFLAANPGLAKALGTVLGALLAYRAVNFVLNASGILGLLSGLNGQLGGGGLARTVAGFGLVLAGLSGALDGLPGPIAGVATALGTFLMLRSALPGMNTVLAGFRTQVGGLGASFAQARAGASGVGGLVSAIGSTAGGGLRGALGGLRGLVSGAVGGPVGLAVAGISTAVGIWAQKHEEARAKAEAYKTLVQSIADSLDRETGALTEATKAVVAKNLMTNGAADSARKYGVDLAELTNAAMGNARSQARVNQALGESAVKAALASDSTGSLSSAMADANVGQAEFGKAILAGGPALDGYIDRLMQAANGDQFMLDNLTALLPTLYDTADGQRALAGKVGSTASATRAAAQSQSTMNALLGKTRGEVQGVIDKLRGMKNKSVTVKALTTDAEANLRKLGYKVQRMPDGSVKITATAATAAASAAIARAARDRTATIRVRTVGGRINVGGGRYANAGQMADGGVITRFSSFADGGIRDLKRVFGDSVRSFAAGSERHIAQIAKAGEMRIWAEPETGGEAYIPLSPAKRPRSMAILDDVANRFGMALEPKLGARLATVTASAPFAAPVAASRDYSPTGDGVAARVAQTFMPGSVNVYNATPEPASKSLADTLRDAADFGLAGR